jgi:hypothetical protein
MFKVYIIAFIFLWILLQMFLRFFHADTFVSFLEQMGLIKKSDLIEK